MSVTLADSSLGQSQSCMSNLQSPHLKIGIRGKNIIFQIFFTTRAPTHSRSFHPFCIAADPFVALTQIRTILSPHASSLPIPAFLRTSTFFTPSMCVHQPYFLNNSFKIQTRYILYCSQQYLTFLINATHSVKFSLHNTLL